MTISTDLSRHFVALARCESRLAVLYARLGIVPRMCEARDQRRAYMQLARAYRRQSLS